MRKASSILNIRKQLLKKFVFTAAMLIVILAVSPFDVSAQENVGMEELNSYIETEFKKTHIPDMSISIVNANEVLFSKSYGSSGSVDSPYILGSISKSFTAVAIMQLVEQGKIDIAAPMAEYLPAVSSDCKTTVKQLLNQTSGIETYMTLENYKTSDTIDDWEYANVNYNLLGQIIENVSGVAYADYIKTNIFEPLNMKNSYVSLKEAKAGGLINGHRNYFGIMVKEEFEYPENTTSGWMTLPAAYIISTANDMGKYLQFYLNGGQDILSAENIMQMYTDTAFAQTDYEYGYGWGVDNRKGEPIFVHGGNVENYTTYMFILPERGLACVMLFNACDYFVANGMAVNLPYNVAYKLMGIETDDIKESTYLQSHLMINAILLLVLIISIIPLIRITGWCAKNKGKIRTKSIIFILLIHAVLPTVIISALSVMGIPMAVVNRFAPDIFMIQIISSMILYATGVFKVTYGILNHRRYTKSTNKTL